MKLTSGVPAVLFLLLPFCTILSSEKNPTWMDISGMKWRKRLKSFVVFPFIFDLLFITNGLRNPLLIFQTCSFFLLRENPPDKSSFSLDLYRSVAGQ